MMLSVQTPHRLMSLQSFFSAPGGLSSAQTLRATHLHPVFDQQQFVPEVALGGIIANLVRDQLPALGSAVRCAAQDPNGSYRIEPIGVLHRMQLGACLMPFAPGALRLQLFLGGPADVWDDFEDKRLLRECKGSAGRGRLEERLEGGLERISRAVFSWDCQII